MNNDLDVSNYMDAVDLLLPSSVDNNKITGKPFPILSVQNLIHEMLRYGDLDASQFNDNTTKQETEMLNRRKALVNKWRETNNLTEEDVDQCKLPQDLLSNNILDRCISEWRYLYTTEKDPYCNCVCGEPIALLHCFQHARKQECVIYIGNCCLNILFGTTGFLLVKGITRLLQRLDDVCNEKMIVVSKAYGLITDEEQSILNAERKLKSKFAPPAIEYATIDDTFRRTMIKYKILRTFVRGELAGKLRQTLCVLLNQLVMLCNFETHRFTSLDAQHFQAKYWLDTHQDDKFAKHYVSLADKLRRKITLSADDTVSWNIFKHQKAIKLLMTTPDCIAQKTLYLSDKSREVGQVKNKLLHELSKIGEFSPMEISNLSQLVIQHSRLYGIPFPKDTKRKIDQVSETAPKRAKQVERRGYVRYKLPLTWYQTDESVPGTTVSKMYEFGKKVQTGIHPQARASGKPVVTPKIPEPVKSDKPIILCKASPEMPAKTDKAAVKGSSLHIHDSVMRMGGVKVIKEKTTVVVCKPTDENVSDEFNASDFVSEIVEDDETLDILKPSQ